MQNEANPVSLSVAGGHALKDDQGIAAAQADAEKPTVRRYNCDFPIGLFAEIERQALERRLPLKEVIVRELSATLLNQRRRPRPSILEDVIVDLNRLVHVGRRSGTSLTTF